MKRSGIADLPLHGGRVPAWLAARMARSAPRSPRASSITTAAPAFLSRLSDPFWFQALGSVMGMDWHSSGITTSVMGALKRGLNPRAHELGIYICGGRGRHSRKTPDELRAIADRTGLDGEALVRTSRLTARIDNNAIADGFQIYLHSFVVTRRRRVGGRAAGDERGDAPGAPLSLALGRRARLHRRAAHRHRRRARRARSGTWWIGRARPAQDALLAIAREDPAATLRRGAPPRDAGASRRARRRTSNQKRLGAVLALAHERELRDFASLLLLEQLGPRTLQSLALVAEVVHGAPTRFDDPARFSFAHGGKDGHPFPVPLKVYDESIAVLRRALDAAKLGHTDKLRRLGAARRVRARDRAAASARTPTSTPRSRTSARSRRRSAAAPCSTTAAARAPPPAREKVN